jgi:hypothetical protein
LEQLDEDQRHIMNNHRRMKFSFLEAYIAIKRWLYMLTTFKVINEKMYAINENLMRDAINKLRGSKSNGPSSQDIEYRKVVGLGYSFISCAYS